MLSSTLIRLTTSSLLFKRTLIDPNPPLVGQAIEIKEYLRENTIPFDESWTSIKALCCRSSNRLSGLIHIEKQTGLEEKKSEREQINVFVVQVISRVRNVRQRAIGINFKLNGNVSNRGRRKI